MSTAINPHRRTCYRADLDDPAAVAEREAAESRRRIKAMRVESVTPRLKPGAWTCTGQRTGVPILEAH